MPKKKAGLTITEIKYLKPKEKIYKIFDGGGLYLAVTPSGGKLWNIKYRFKGKSKKISIGSYPAVSLSLARDKLKEIKELIALDTNPMEQRKADKTEIISKDVNTFGNICLEWFEQQSAIWAIGHAKKIQGRIDNDIFEFTGSHSRDNGKPQQSAWLPVERLVILSRSPNCPAIYLKYRHDSC